MVCFPNCKINLGLNVVRKRADGYHDLETFFYPLPILDALEIISNPHSKENEISFSQSGLQIDSDTENNLCVKAYRLLKKSFLQLPAVQMHLHKAIPAGAGAGGGSADGAFTLQLLNKKFQLQITEPQMLQYALQLGSDCPFFILNKPCFATGRGQQLQHIPLNLSQYKILFIYPQVHISTQWAFQQITPQQPYKSIIEIIQQPIETWKHELKNDFEKPVLQYYPQLSQIPAALYNAGALYASMSGSGSSFYGLFKNDFTIPQLHLPRHYFVKECAMEK